MDFWVTKIKPQRAAALLCFAYFTVILLVSSFHKIGTYGVETDFYGGYAFQARSLWAGEKWDASLHGPGYPLILGLVNFVCKDMFLSGKRISMISSVLLAFFASKLFEGLFSRKIALLALPVLFTNPIFGQYSLSAGTDMFFAFLFVLMLFFLFREPLRYSNVILAGIVGGFAFMTRTTGAYFLVAAGTCLLLVEQRSWRARTVCSVSMAVAFLAVASPWLVSNYRRTGSPIPTQTYIYIGASYAGPGDSLITETQQKVAEKYKSARDVLTDNPARLIKFFLKNWAANGVKTLMRLFPMGWFVFLVSGGLMLLRAV